MKLILFGILVIAILTVVISFLNSLKKILYWNLNSGGNGGPNVSNGMVYNSSTGCLEADQAPIT
jgi:hypothetical protein